MIKAIVFDLDGMIVEEETLFSKAFSKKYGIVWETVLEFFLNEYKQCLVGKADVEEEFMKYVRKWGLKDVTWEDVAEFWFEDNVTFQSEFIALTKSLRAQGIKCVLASNNEKRRKEYMSKKYNFNDMFDEVIFSSDTEAKKPSKKFVKYMLEQIHLAPGEVLFCDDQESNIKELEKQGFQTYIYTDFDSFIEELRELGVEV